MGARRARDDGASNHEQVTRIFGLQGATVVPLKPEKSHARLVIALVGLLVVGGAILAITMWPHPVDRGYAGTIERILEILHRRGVPAWFGYHKLEFTANIVMFMPLGFFVALILHRRVQWLGWILVPLISAGIETTQLLLLEDRYATVPDVIANSLGGWVGVAVALFIRAGVYARDEKVYARRQWEKRYGDKV